MVQLADGYQQSWLLSLQKENTIKTYIVQRFEEVQVLLIALQKEDLIYNKKLLQRN
jgi:hypothetical protein